MKLIMLGAGGFTPTDQAQTACYLLPEQRILLDAGSGLYRLPQFMLTAAALDVYLSHTHGDHTSGLHTIFGSYFKQLADETPAPVDVTYIDAILKRANELLDATRIHVTGEMLPALKSEFRHLTGWSLLQAAESLPEGGALTHFALKPGREEIGFRLDWPGHSLAYITDTTASPDAAYIEHIAGVDLLLHDCNLPDDKAGIAAHISHSSTSAVAQVAARARVKRLFLIHKNPLGWPIEDDLPAARQIFPATEIGQDGMEVKF